MAPTLRTPTEAFTARFTMEQKEACAVAVNDRGVTVRDVVKQAAAGQLGHNGRTLEPFDVSKSYVYDLARGLRHRRQGKTSQIGDMEHRDAIEALRRRFLTTADDVLDWEEKRQPNRRDLERIRQCARMVREAAALPGPKDPRPPSPAAGKHAVDRTTGMAGKILAEHRRAPRNDDGPAQGEPVEEAE